MSTASSAVSAQRRRGPHIPLVPCPTCRRMVVQSRSGTKGHNGWVFYKCPKHGRGCNFWHWELEYVCFLIDEEILRGEQAMEALGWAQERREELKLRQEENEAILPAEDEMVVKMLSSLLLVLKEVALLLRIVVGILVLVCAVMILKK